jgi:hypothetical protein
MSVQNFIPELWSKKILKELDKAHMLVKNCSTSYSGEISGLGSKVKINSINSPTIGDYVPNSTVITPEQLKDESRMLEITQAKYFAFFLDDVDAKQATGGLLEEGLRKAVIALKDAAEVFITTKFTEAYKTITNASLTSGDFYSTFAKAKRYLMKSNVGITDDIVAEVSPEVWEKGVLANILYNNQNNGDVIKKGQYVESLGMTFHVSNNIAVTETSEDIAASTCVVRTKEAIGYAEQIMKTEKYMPENAFSDAIKGLHVYGAKALKPKEMVALVLTTAAETLI